MSILAINGIIGSGKDTVAKMIQRIYLCKELDKGKTFAQSVPSIYDLDKHHTLDGSDWEVKKFAGKLKLILSMLTGIHVSNFEDQDFKANTCINLITFDVKHKSELACSFYDQEHKDVVINLVKNKLHNVYITVRLLLQIFGTEIMRYWLPEVWVNALYADLNPMDNWLVTDLRFENEFDGTKRRGGFTIRVFRDQNIILNDPAKHASETGLDTYYKQNKFDYTIPNTGSLEDLEQKVIAMLKHFNLY